MANTSKHNFDFYLDDSNAAQINEFLQKTSDENLAKIIDSTLKNHFGSLNDTFESEYQMHLSRLRYKDSLRERIKILKKYKKQLKNLRKYEFLLKAQPQIRKLYNDWKMEYVRIYGKSGIYSELYYDEHISELNNRISPATITSKETFKKLISPRDKTFKNTQPQVPEVPRELIASGTVSVNPLVDSLKSDSELLLNLGRPTLEEIIDVMIAQWSNKDTSILNMRLLFIVTHFCNSNTKGDGNSNRDKYSSSQDDIKPVDRKSISKTNGPSITALEQDYQKLILEIKNL